MGYLRWRGNGKVVVIDNEGKPAYILKISKSGKTTKLPFSKKRARRN